MSEFSDSLAVDLNSAMQGVIVRVAGNKIHATGLEDPEFAAHFRTLTKPADDPAFQAFIQEVQRIQPASGAISLHIVGDDKTPDATLAIAVDAGHCTFTSTTEAVQAQATLAITWSAIRRLLRNPIGEQSAQVAPGEVTTADGDTMLLETVRQMMVLPTVVQAFAQRVSE